MRIATVFGQLLSVEVRFAVQLFALAANNPTPRPDTLHPSHDALRSKTELTERLRRVLMFMWYRSCSTFVLRFTSI